MIRWFVDCDCDYIGGPYVYEGNAVRAAARHLDANPIGHQLEITCLLPGESCPEYEHLLGGNR